MHGLAFRMCQFGWSRMNMMLSTLFIGVLIVYAPLVLLGTVQRSMRITIHYLMLDACIFAISHERNACLSRDRLKLEFGDAYLELSSLPDRTTAESRALYGCTTELLVEGMPN